MNQHRLRIVALAGAVLLLAACATPPKAPHYGYWSYVRTPIGPFWWAELIDINGARAKAGTGAGTTVAIVGTGVLKRHEDLLTVVPGEATCGNTPADTDDRNGHGTQLTGIVAGIDPGAATRGVAPHAAVIPIKVDCGAVSAEALTKGVDAAIARKPDIILIAIGGYPSADVSSFMLSRVTGNSGILFVVASVWDGTHYAFPTWTQTDNALLVASMTLDAEKGDPTRIDRTKEIPYSARRGDIWAPGRNIGTADIELEAGSTTKHSQYLMHGTSPAAAAVAGCAALVKTKIGARGADLKRALLAGAEPKPDLGPGPNGRLNCARAVP